MKFNINDYKGKYAMHCKTEEEAKIFCRYLDSVGRKWGDGDSYMSMTNWDVYGPDTYYDFNDGAYCEKTYFLTCNYTILEFSDFEWDNKKCKPFKVGDRVRCIDGLSNARATGKTGTVIDTYISGCQVLVEFDKNIGGHDGLYETKGKDGHCWWLSESVLELTNTKRKPVIIYQNGQEIVALDKETGEKAKAKCHPNDEFDFAIGAKIAFGRLYHSQDYIPEGNKAKCKPEFQPEFQVGDRVRFIKKDYEISDVNIVDKLGVIRETGTGASSVLVEFDKDIGGHSGGGKGKDGHCWWVMNSSEYLELVGNKDAKEINVGDRVKVTNPGRAYSSYAEWVTKNAPEFAVYYVYTLYYTDIYKKLGTSTFTVVAKAPHTDFTDRMLYLVQDEFARCFLLGEEGIEKCN